MELDLPLALRMVGSDVKACDVARAHVNASGHGGGGTVSCTSGTVRSQCCHSQWKAAIVYVPGF